MTVQVFDFRRAGLSLPESVTAGDEVTYAGRATRAGVAQTLKFRPAGGLITNGEEWNTLIIVPDEEHWYIRSLLARFVLTTGSIDDGSFAAYLWRAISEFGIAGDAWTNFDPNAGRPLDGLAPFDFATADAWLQIIEAKVQPMGRQTWRFDTEIFVRHLYPREVINLRYVAGGNAASSPQVAPSLFLDVIRYPTAPRVLERLRLIHGSAASAVVLGSMIEATQDTAPEAGT